MLRKVQRIEDLGRQILRVASMLLLFAVGGVVVAAYVTDSFGLNSYAQRAWSLDSNSA